MLCLYKENQIILTLAMFKVDLSVFSSLLGLDTVECRSGFSKVGPRDPVSVSAFAVVDLAPLSCKCPGTGDIVLFVSLRPSDVEFSSGEP